MIFCILPYFHVYAHQKIHLFEPLSTYILSVKVIFEQFLNVYQIVDQYLYYHVLYYLPKLIVLFLLLYPALFILA